MDYYNKYQKYFNKIINIIGGENNIEHNLPKSSIDMVLYYILP